MVFGSIAQQHGDPHLHTGCRWGVNGASGKCEGSLRGVGGGGVSVPSTAMRAVAGVRAGAVFGLGLCVGSEPRMGARVSARAGRRAGPFIVQQRVGGLCRRPGQSRGASRTVVRVWGWGRTRGWGRCLCRCMGPGPRWGLIPTGNRSWVHGLGSPRCGT